MDRELEIAGAASLGGWLKWKRRLTLPVGTPCPNCATPLEGPYCYTCGQLGEQFHRSLLPLVWEVFESFFHADGRLLHTLPRLIRRPGQLTKDYIEGHRAAQVPPLRLFLVVMLIYFFVGGLQGHKNLIQLDGPREAASDPNVPAEVKARLRETTAARETQAGTEIGQWFEKRVKYASTHQREFTYIFEEWTHRIAIAMLPVAAAILSLLFVLRRRFYVFDHLIFSMHSLSFMGLLASAGTLIGLIPVVGGIGGLLFFVAPAHLFVHMREVYGTGVFGTLWRMLVLFILSSIALGVMMMAVLVIGLNEMEGAPEAKTPAPAHGAPAKPSAPAAPKLKLD
jgi:hypothetical protein